MQLGAFTSVMQNDRTKTWPTRSRRDAIAARRRDYTGDPYAVTGAYMARHRAQVKAAAGGGRTRAARLFAAVPDITVLPHRPVPGDRAAIKRERADRRAARRAA